LSNPIIEIFQPFLNWQKFHGYEKREGNGDQQNESANCAFRCVFTLCHFFRPARVWYRTLPRMLATAP